MISRRPEYPQLEQTEHLKFYSIYLQLVLHVSSLLLAMESGLVYEKSIFGAAGLLAYIALVPLGLQMFGFNVVHKTLLATGLVATHCTRIGPGPVLDNTGFSLQSHRFHLT